jgi:hypothetical protein
MRPVRRPTTTLYASGTHAPVQRDDLNPGRPISEVCRRGGRPAHPLIPGDGVTRS